MKSRPIMFTAPMVRALLDGSKTQTRRVVKFPLKGPWMGAKRRVYFDLKKKDLAEAVKLCPYGKVGDRLWVRETWCPVKDDERSWVDYRATPWDDQSAPAGWHNASRDVDALKWRSPMMMPRWASRIELEVTEVRLQRLHQITNEDAKAEGISADSVADFGGHLAANVPGAHRAGFEQAWRTIHGKMKHQGKNAWEHNVWVWAISFRRIKS